jgi:hypothetical protein
VFGGLKTITKSPRSTSKCTKKGVHPIFIHVRADYTVDNIKFDSGNRFVINESGHHLNIPRYPTSKILTNVRTYGLLKSFTQADFGEKRAHCRPGRQFASYQVALFLSVRSILTGTLTVACTVQQIGRRREPLIDKQNADYHIAVTEFMVHHMTDCLGCVFYTFNSAFTVIFSRGKVYLCDRLIVRTHHQNRS